MEEIKKDYIGNINFADEMTLTTIGCWMEVLRQRYIMEEIANDNVELTLKDEEEAQKISKIFYKLLKQTYYKFDDRITITYESANPDDRKMYYNIHLDEQNKDIKLELEEGGGLEYSSYLTIIDGNNKIVSTLINSSNPDIESLDLDVYIYNDPAKKIKYERTFGHYYERVSLKNDNNQIDFYARFPDRVVKEYYAGINSNKTDIILPEEKELQHFLCNLTFPVNIDHVFAKMRQYTIFNGSALEEYPDFEISVYNDNYENRVTGPTDKITYKNGERVEYINTHLDSSKKYITFADDETLVSLAQWTHVINLWDLQKNLKNPEDVHKIVTDELQIKGKDKVEALFYKFLYSTEFNIDDQVTVSLISSNEEDRFLNYNLHLDKQNKDLGLKLITGGGLEWPDERYVSEGNKEFVYSLVKDENNAPVLKKTCEYYTYDNCEYERDCVGSHVHMMVRQGEYKLYLDFNVKKTYDGQYFRLNHEDEDRKYLCNLTFPVNIDEVFDNIYKISELNKGLIADYPRLYLSINKWDENHYLTQDVIEYQNGSRTQYINTSLTNEQQLEQERINKVAMATSKDIDLSLVDGPESDFYGEVLDEKKPRM